MAWLDIKTAPRDGSKVDLWIETIFKDGDGRPNYGERETDCYFIDNNWRKNSCSNCSLEDEFIEWEAKHCKVFATHWMPLPPKPK